MIFLLCASPIPIKNSARRSRAMTGRFFFSFRFFRDCEIAAAERLSDIRTSGFTNLGFGLRTAAEIGRGSTEFILISTMSEETALVKHAKYDGGVFHARRHITGREPGSGSLAARQ